MSLNNRLKKVKAIGEEKKITLRIPESKAKILEKLAKHYGTTTSSLIREMIDNSIIELQKDFIVFDDELGLDVKDENGEYSKTTYLPSIIELIAPELEANFTEHDFCDNVQEYENFLVKDSELAKKHGRGLGISFISKISGEEINTIELAKLKGKK